MRNIQNLRQALSEKRLLKVISGINNIDLERVEMIVSSAIESRATAVDVAAKREVLELSTRLIESSHSEIALFASSIVPEELAMAVNEYHVDAIELGNFDAMYRESGKTLSSMEVLNLVRETLSMINKEEVMFSVTIPGSLSINDQISLARELELLNIDMIQTEGYVSEEMIQSSTLEGSRALLNRAELTISNTLELSRNIELPIMTASNINTITAPFAFAAGASAIGCGSCINRLESKIQMLAIISSLVEISNRNSQMMMMRKEQLV